MLGVKKVLSSAPYNGKSITYDMESQGNFIFILFCLTFILRALLRLASGLYLGLDVYFYSRVSN